MFIADFTNECWKAIMYLLVCNYYIKGNHLCIYNDKGNEKRR